MGILASIVLHIEELNMGNDPNQLVTIDQFWMNRKGYLFFGERDDGKRLTMEEHYFSCEEKELIEETNSENFLQGSLGIVLLKLLEREQFANKNNILYLNHILNKNSVSVLKLLLDKNRYKMVRGNELVEIKSLFYFRGV